MLLSLAGVDDAMTVIDMVTVLMVGVLILMVGVLVLKVEVVVSVKAQVTGCSPASLMTIKVPLLLPYSSIDGFVVR